ncbi:RagB/SusD family nutrient uptake outer membrane protein [Formosa sp. PL04]|uniref:RagB/SusD family nutrient uptake outer membrane protein n=1 Tax=Formosa sp. PL04 TaxID=3081755 RepID=UPI0029810716|nr:RagB/SusD family nutrient uptake outer membrane protein [Formosa sp. PL04]MDW5289172.1 RagB/SusD family nutrient uptake outer membrane protein [Formosa sp. PL04]
MKTINYKISFLALLFLTITGCSENVLNEETPSIVTANSLFLDLAGFEAALNGLYARVRMEREGRATNDSDRSSDRLRAEMFVSGTDNMCTNHRDGWGRVAEPWAETNNAFDSELQGNFEWLYSVINAANTIVERAENEGVDWGANEESKDRVVAEARAMRAWAYRHLTFTWGAVPLTLKESNGSDIKTDWERTPVSEIRSQIEADLLFAEQYIPVSPLPGRISKGAVQHYLAELYLVLNDPAKTVTYADKVINTPEYALVTNRYGSKSNEPGSAFTDMFYDGNTNREEGNTEALWVWQWEFATIGGEGSNMRRWHSSRYNDINIGGVTPFELTVERGGRPRARMSLTKFAIDLYEPQDDRFSNQAIRKYFILKDATQNKPAIADVLPDGYKYGDTINLNWSEPITSATRNRLDWPFSRKFEWGTELDITGSYQYNDQVYIRLADTYLLKAEAQFLIGNSSDAAATINIIRERSNATPITEGDMTIDYILDERSRELVLEEHRRYTLLRTQKWLERTQLHNFNGGENIRVRDTILPIPQNVIDANLTGEIKQNPGYN